LIREETLDACQGSVLESARRVCFAFADDRQAGLLVGAGGASGLAKVADIVSLVVVNAEGDAAVSSEREGNPVELALVASLIVGAVDDTVLDVLNFPALVVYENKAVLNNIARTAVVVGSTAGGNSDAGVAGGAP